MAHKETGEAVAGELAPMVGVEDLWLSFAQSFFQEFDTKFGAQSVGQVRGHHVPTMPIYPSAEGPGTESLWPYGCR